MDSKRDPEKTLKGTWCVDSETGYQYLIDDETKEIIAKWIKKEPS